MIYATPNFDKPDMHFKHRSDRIAMRNWVHWQHKESGSQNIPQFIYEEFLLGYLLLYPHKKNKGASYLAASPFSGLHFFHIIWSK